MNNSVVVNGGLQEENSLADDVKNILSNALSLLDSGIDVAKNELNNIYGEANGEKIFNLAKSVKLHIIDFALNYDKNKSTDENIAHYAGNFIEAVFIGTAAASVLGTTISGGWGRTMTENTSRTMT